MALKQVVRLSSPSLTSLHNLLTQDLFRTLAPFSHHFKRLRLWLEIASRPIFAWTRVNRFSYYKDWWQKLQNRVLNCQEVSCKASQESCPQSCTLMRHADRHLRSILANLFPTLSTWSMQTQTVICKGLSERRSQPIVLKPSDCWQKISRLPQESITISQTFWRS